MGKFRVFLVLVWLFMVVCAIGQVPYNDIDLIDNYKVSLFGGQYNNLYDYWFGVRGKGKGLSCGEIGLVFGFNKVLFVKEKYKLELYVDTFVYADLFKLNFYGLSEYGEWLLWEINIWFGLH